LEAIGNRTEVDEEEDDDVCGYLDPQRPRFLFLRSIGGVVVEGPSVSTVTVVVSTTVGK
jgi:hypothetical protein